MSARRKQSRVVAIPMPRKAKASNRGTRLMRRFKKLQKLVARWMRKVNIARPERKLRVVETVSLGEKRIVAVVQFEQQRFLVGASGTTMSLLSNLEQGTAGFAMALAHTNITEQVGL